MTNVKKRDPTSSNMDLNASSNQVEESQRSTRSHRHSIFIMNKSYFLIIIGKLYETEIAHLYQCNFHDILDEILLNHCHYYVCLVEIGLVEYLSMSLQGRCNNHIYWVCCVCSIQINFQNSMLQDFS